MRLQAILSLADRAVSVIRGGDTVLISCKAGRGRSGTMAALIVGRLEGISSHSELVDAIVLITGKTCIGKLSEFIGILTPNC